MKRSLLVEIGCEELPASYIRPAAESLRLGIERLLKTAQIGFDGSRLFFTPCRLAVLVEGVSSKALDRTVEVQGPPRTAGYDEFGNPSPMAQGFAAAHGKRVEDLYTKVLPKGEYLFLRRRIKGVKTRQILEERLPELIAGIPFPKGMRWPDSTIRFARPIRWILALLGREVIRFELAGIRSGRYTRGHRFLAPSPIRVEEPAEYEPRLIDNHCIPDFEQRRDLIQKGLESLLREVGGRWAEDRPLLDEVANLVEYPYPIRCRFKEEFLELPAPVLVTALKYHQRCFSVVGEDGRLLPYFIAVTNTPTCNPDEVRRWYERVVEARLTDARFYFEADLKEGFDRWLAKEKEVIWIEGLGTLYDKTQRLIELMPLLAQGVKGVDLELQSRAALLCKADLLSQMVREPEFTSLQGVMGQIYAERLGEDPQVARAIGEHYLPQGGEDPTPGSIAGALLSIADKLDNLTASFLVGQIPTGSEDPFALRRQATGLLECALSHRVRLSFDSLIRKELELFKRSDGPAGSIHQFLKERMEAWLLEKGVSYDIVDAVLAVGSDDPVDAWERCQALNEFRTGEGFEALVIGQKRVANILKGLKPPPPPTRGELKEKATIDLYDRAKEVESRLSELVRKGEYKAGLDLLLSLRQSIDTLFDEILVMAEEPELRRQRLGLVGWIKSIFDRIADLSRLVLEGVKGR